MSIVTETPSVSLPSSFLSRGLSKASLCTREVGPSWRTGGGLGVRFRVGGLNREPLGSQEGVKFRLRGLGVGRASLLGEAGSIEREGVAHGG